MENTLESRVDALEKDVAEVKGQIADLAGQVVKTPQGVDAMIDGLLYAAVADAYDKATNCRRDGDRTNPDVHTMK